jgi:hypothetical protein
MDMSPAGPESPSALAATDVVSATSAVAPAARDLSAAPGRDVRIDFIRGWVMLILVVVHTEVFSLWNLLVWERVGLISGGEGFVLLSGLVLGVVSRQRILRSGWADASSRLIDRALQLYRVHVTLILLVGLLALTIGPHVHEIISFTDRGSGTVYQLYPSHTDPIRWVGQVLLLRAGPHQVQVLGLYVCLMLICPLMIGMLANKRTAALLGLSWILYFSNILSAKMPTGAQFEYAFPLLTWQVLFVHGLAIGYHFQAIQTWFRSRAGHLMFLFCVIVTASFLVFAQGASNGFFPEWARIDLWPNLYNKVHVYAEKNTLGLVRLLNYGVFLVVAYAALTRWWPFFQKTMGWFLVPIGQATLYVFIVHLFIVQLASMILPFGFSNATPLWQTTLLHTAELALLWLMVRRQVLFRWIPR